MAAPAAASVDEVRPLLVRSAKPPGEAVCVGGTENEMHVIGHQAIGPHADLRLAHLFGKNVAIDVLIAVFEKDGFTAVAARRDVMRAAWNDDAQEPGHGPFMTDALKAIFPRLSHRTMFHTQLLSALGFCDTMPMSAQLWGTLSLSPNYA